MRNKKFYACVAVLSLTSMLGGVDAAFDESLNTYTLDAVVVTADKTRINSVIRLLNSRITEPVVT